MRHRTGHASCDRFLEPLAPFPSKREVAVQYSGTGAGMPTIFEIAVGQVLLPTGYEFLWLGASGYGCRLAPNLFYGQTPSTPLSLVGQVPLANHTLLILYSQTPSVDGV